MTRVVDKSVKETAVVEEVAVVDNTNDQLLREIHRRYVQVENEKTDNLLHNHLSILFMGAVEKAMDSVALGADPLEFHDLVLAEFLVACDLTPYSAKDIAHFVEHNLVPRQPVSGFLSAEDVEEIESW